MANMVYPNPRYRSVTAATGIGDAHDGMVYSAGVLAHGGTGLLKLFSVQFGQTIPELKGAAITAPVQLHQQTYTLLTTNLDRPSQLGDNLGDASLRALGITIEQAAYPDGAAVLNRAFGATDFEVSDILSKCAGEFKIGAKPQIQSPLWGYPQLGGVSGSISTTQNAATIGVLTNGSVPTGRVLRTPMMLGRYDSLSFELSVQNGATLAFSATGADGQPTLVWCMILVDFMSDVR